MVIQPTRKLFTVDEFHRMGEARIFAEDDRVELIGGEILEMTPIGPRHATTIMLLTDLLVYKIRDHAFVNVQNVLTLNDRNEFHPDFALLRRRSDYYRNQMYAPEDVFLVIEVSDTTLAYDQKKKMPCYAKAGIPEVWIVDLNHDQVLIYSQPSPDGYKQINKRNRGDWVESLILPELRIEVSQIMGE